MVFSFLRRGKGHLELGEHVKKINSSLVASFKNIKDDISSINSWLNHFNDKHDDHEKKSRLILARMDKLESDIAMLQELIEKNSIIVRPEIESEKYRYSESVWDSLTETQQKICWKLALMQKELPDQWISLKYLAQELYPEKEYNQVRSTVSQFIGGLEELGFVKRRRKGKLAYVYSTDKNPCYDKKKEIGLLIPNLA